MSLRSSLEMLLEYVPAPPDRNCSCHISPPCHDCIEYGGLREAIEEAQAAIEADDKAQARAVPVVESNVMRSADDPEADALIEYALQHAVRLMPDVLRRVADFDATNEDKATVIAEFMATDHPETTNKTRAFLLASLLHVAEPGYLASKEAP